MRAVRIPVLSIAAYPVGMRPWTPDAYADAYRFAAEAHQGQLVPGTQLPYLMHLSLVSMEVMGAIHVEEVRDPDLAVQCALLHDALEDTDATVDSLRSRFDPAVVAGVQALTKDSALPKAERMADSLLRIRDQPHEVWMVKLADRTTNLMPPPSHWDLDKRRRYHAEAETILDALGQGSAHLAQRLRTRLESYREHLR